MPCNLRTLRAIAFGAVVGVLTLGGAGCAGAAPGSGDVPSRARFLSIPELYDPSVKDGLLLDAIQRLRPHFLLTRTSTSRDGAVPVIEVSMNGGLLAPLSTIADLRVSAVRSVTLVPAAEAGPRFGLRDRSGPVLLVQLR
jgi:delta 1-pyrroline-5-carboxylate dehydrogenase